MWILVFRNNTHDCIIKGASHMLKWSQNHQYLIQPQVVHVPALCKLSLWLVSSITKSVALTNHRTRFYSAGICTACGWIKYGRWWLQFNMWDAAFDLWWWWWCQWWWGWWSWVVATSTPIFNTTSTNTIITTSTTTRPQWPPPPLSQPTPTP